MNNGAAILVNLNIEFIYVAAIIIYIEVIKLIKTLLESNRGRGGNFLPPHPSKRREPSRLPPSDRSRHLPLPFPPSLREVSISLSEIRGELLQLRLLPSGHRWERVPCDVKKVEG
ncbi:hypothetical protein TNCV_4111251 [Trichonephila clavipes]|nr:hypothetical protein TNCV_4111251 [Trichonephila clavipes]